MKRVFLADIPGAFYAEVTIKTCKITAWFMVLALSEKLFR
jgi:hypothetical protein